ncbi:MAG: dihydrodipicolinate synthase family protein [Actinocatenispora sp.]
MPAETLRRGLWGVLATPFHENTLRIDDNALLRQVDHHLSAGSTGLVVLGVFGESAQLGQAERVHVVDLVTRHARGVPTVIGLAERDTAAAITAATQLMGAAHATSPSLMLQIPDADPRRLAAHLRAVHDATATGIVVQDYPVVSGVTIGSAPLLAALAECPFVVAVKSEAPPTSLAIVELTAGTRVPVFGGLGGLGLLDELMAGAAGSMTGFSHPEGLAATLRAWDEGGYEAACEAYLPWLPLVNFEAQARIGLAIRKSSLHERGVFGSAAVRPPALAMPASLLPLLRAHLRRLARVEVA